MTILRMSDLDLAGKRVLIRQDLNVPIANGRITSDARLRASLPTLKLAQGRRGSGGVASGASEGRPVPARAFADAGRWLAVREPRSDGSAHQ